MSTTQKVKEIPIVPIEYAGQWIAWNEDHTKIITSAKGLPEAHKKALKTGEEHFWMEKIPSSTDFFSGANWQS